MYRNSFAFVMAIIMVAILSTAGFASTDSMTVVLNNGDTTTVELTMQVAQDMYNQGEVDASAELVKAINVKDQMAKFEADKQKAEAKAFWAEVDSVTNEIPKDLDSVIVWIDTPSKGTAALISYGVSKRQIDTQAEVAEFRSLVRQAAMMMSMIQNHCVELNGPAHTAMLAAIDTKPDSNFVLDAATASCEVALAESIKNTEMINLINDRLSDIEVKALTAFEAIDFVKIHSKASKDAQELKAKIEAKVRDGHTPLEWPVDEGSDQ